MEKRELAFNLYKDSNGEKPLKDIALELKRHLERSIVETYLTKKIKSMFE